MIFGASLQNIYLIVLIVAGTLTFLYILFHDFLEGVSELIPFIHPALILAFFTFLSASGYLFERLTSWNSFLLFFISIIIAVILDIFLHLFVLVPLSSAEKTLTYTLDSLKGRRGEVIISIPKDGYGEVILKGASGTIGKAATSFNGEAIDEGTEILVVEVENGVLRVVPYEKVDPYQIDF